MAASTGMREQVCQHRTGRINQPGRTDIKNSQERTARTGQPKRDSWNRASSTGQKDLDCQHRIVRTELRGQDSQSKTAGTGKP
jgi:hypothetical protein